MCASARCLTQSVLRGLQEYVAEFERSEVARQTLMAALMGSFDQRTWVQVSSILVRITYGHGFAQVRAPSLLPHPCEHLPQLPGPPATLLPCPRVYLAAVMRAPPDLGTIYLA